MSNILNSRRLVARTIHVLAIALVAIASLSERVAADVEKLLDLLPPDTKGAIVVGDYARARKSFTAGNDTDRDSLGRFQVQADELEGMAVGPVLRLRRSSGQSLLVVEAKSQKQALETLGKISQRLMKSGVSGSETKVGEQDGQKFLWVERGQQRTVLHLTYNQFAIFATDVDTAADCISRLTSDEAQPLPPGWERSRRQSLPETAGTNRYHWYLQPWLLQAGESKSEDYQRAEKHGITGLKSSSGELRINAEGNASALELAFAPQPRASSLRIMQLVPAKQQLVIPDWLSLKVDSLSVLNADLPQALEHIGPLYDDLYAEGAEGTYEDILNDVKDPDGLNLDLKVAMYKFLGPRYVVAQGVGEGSALTAFEVQDEKQIASVMQQLMGDDPEVEKGSIPGCKETLWRVLPQDKDDPVFGIIVARGFLFFAEDEKDLRAVLTADAEKGWDASLDQLRAWEKATSKKSCMLLSARPDAEEPEQVVVQMLFVDPTELRLNDAETNSATDVIGQVISVFPGCQHAIGFAEKDGWSLYSTDR